MLNLKALTPQTKTTMYDHLEARLHDVFWNAEGHAVELELLEIFLRQHPGTSLELGCGSGRLLLPLLEKGHFIEGLDSSEDMLALCKERSADPELILHHANIEDFQTGALYSSITIPAFTLQFIPPEKLADVFSNIRKQLHPEGGLYLTTFTPWAEITGELEEDQWFLDQETALDDGTIARCQTRFQIERMSQRLTREHRYEIVTQDGEIIESSTSTHHLNWFWPNELQRFLEAAGFIVEQMIGDFDATAPFDENCQIVTYFGRNPEQ